MRAYQSGDSLAFQVIYSRHSGRVYAFLKRRLEKREEIDEVFQQVFTKFHLSRSQYDPTHALAQWLYVLTKSVLLDHWRKESKKLDRPFENELALEETVAEDVQAEPAMGRERLQEVFKTLALDQRQAVELRMFDELSYEEIAKKLGKTPLNVRQMISRALKKMKSKTMSEGGEAR